MTEREATHTRLTPDPPAPRRAQATATPGRAASRHRVAPIPEPRQQDDGAATEVAPRQGDSVQPRSYGGG